MAIQISGTTVIDNSRNITNVIGVGDTNATIFYGDGSNLLGISASAEFSAKISNSVKLSPQGTESEVFAFPSTSGKKYIIESMTACNTDINGNEVNLTVSIDFFNGKKVNLVYNCPIPAGGLVELIKKPQVVNPSDSIKMLSLDSSYVGNFDSIDVYMSYSEYTDINFFGLGDSSNNSSSEVGIFTSTGGPSIIESLRITNSVDNGDHPVTIKIEYPDQETFIAKDLIVPRSSSIELCDRPKRIETDGVIIVQQENINTINVLISGKKIV
jgi:hypothetical protein